MRASGMGGSTGPSKKDKEANEGRGCRMDTGAWTEAKSEEKKNSRRGGL